MVEHFYVNFGDSSCNGFLHIVQKRKQTDAQTNGGKTPTRRLPLARVKIRRTSLSLRAPPYAVCGMKVDNTE